MLTVGSHATFHHHPLNCVTSIPPDTPFEGMEFKNWPRYTILRGKVMWANGELKGKTRDGEYLKRGSSLLGGGMPGAVKDPRRVPYWLD